MLARTDWSLRPLGQPLGWEVVGGATLHRNAADFPPNEPRFMLRAMVE